MHELSLIADVVRLVEQDAARRAITKISRVELEVGELSGAFPHALKAAFPIASRGTIMEDAELVISLVKADVRCRSCGREFVPTKEGWACPSCGSYEAELRRGTELQVVSYTGEEGECPSR